MDRGASQEMKAPAFQLYASDFYMDTTGWTATQVGIYFRLLMSEWVNGFVPNNIEALARIAQVDPGNFTKSWKGGESTLPPSRGSSLPMAMGI